MRSRWFIIPAAIAGTAVVLVLATAPATRPPDQPPLNVLLITLDTTRWDRLGCYGYAKAETPALDALAARGERFEQAFTHVPLTLPSHATILTGLHPPEHGLHDNGRGQLGPSTRTLAELFRERGYRTGAFVASFVLDRQFGLDRGFDCYDDRMTAGTGTENVFDQENRADVVADRALAWLAETPAQPFFCWVHFYDPHLPYEPPEAYRSRFADPYDGEVAFVDSQVARLVEFLDRAGLRARTLVIACGDHGEAFGEHQENGHGALVYDTTMHVPLILSLPGRVPEGKVVSRLVGLVDVAQTVLDLLGWMRPPEICGHNLLAGEGPAGRACFGESEFLFNSHGWAPLYSLTTRHWRYIDCPKPELYDRIADPEEVRNLAGERPEAVAELKAELAALRAVLQKGRAAELELDERAIATLRQLGYLGGRPGEPPTPTAPGRLKDPKAMMDVFNATREARDLFNRLEYREVVSRLEPVVPKSPESAEIHELLAESYLALGEQEEAKPHVEACLALDPGNRTMQANLATVLLAMKRYDEAAQALEKGLRMTPRPDEPIALSGVSKTTTRLRVSLGVAWAAQGKLDDAAAQYRLALEGEPGHAEANCNLADVYVKQGKDRLAVQHYRRATEAAPERPEAWRSLGLALCKEKEYEEALDAWRAGLKQRPGEPALLQDLAWWLATCPDAKQRKGREAVELAKTLCDATGWTSVEALDTLAAAHAEAGDFAKAVETARTALGLAKMNPALAEQTRAIEKRLALYHASKPYRQP